MTETFDITIRLDAESLKFYKDGAKRYGISLSAFMRMIPRLVTPAESALIDKLREDHHGGNP